MTEIRVYYESIEQAEHYIKPIIENALLAANHQAEIKFVRKIGNEKGIASVSKYFGEDKNILRAIYSLVIPDILITGVFSNNDREYQEIPLLIIEFTETVKTEDHELQRTYGAVAAMFANCFYVKIASRKKTDKKHAGAPIDPFTIPRSFLEKLGYEGFIHCEWNTESDNPYKLLRMPGYFGCPPQFPILAETLNAAVSQFAVNKIDWFNSAIAILKKTEAHRCYLERLSEADSLTVKLVEWQGREKKQPEDKTRFYVRPESIAAKIYRFEKAMDPDRGIITFLSTMFSEEREVFGIYSLVRPKSDDEVLKEKLIDLSQLMPKTIAAFDKDKRTVPAWFEKAVLEQIREAVDNNLPLNQTFDITETLLANKDNISNKVIRTICYFTDGIFLNYNGLKITWNRFALLGFERKDFLAELRRQYGFGIAAKPLPIEPISGNCTEDEVTYAIVHRVLVPNGFKIISVSYPGAQGGEAVLPEPDKGKSQSRVYLDVIAFPPADAESEFDVLLNENKEVLSADVITDVAKLKQFKENAEYKTALKTSLIKAKVVTPDGELGEIVIGIGFGEGNLVEWNPDDVDFIFRVQKRTRWQIGIFHEDLRQMIARIEGDTNLPVCYQVVPRKAKNSKAKTRNALPLLTEE